jgi:hypothetical protein
MEDRIMADELFTDGFLQNVRLLIERHHSIYPLLPPQGVFFEALVEQAFLLSGLEKKMVIPSATNSPWHDLLVAGVKLSIKSETGKITRVHSISITKLCTTETGKWDATALARHAVEHVGRHDRMLMLRAIWGKLAFRYQLVEIPLSLLKLLATARFIEVGKRAGRKSLGGDVVQNGKVVYHVHFDGADGKCQVRQLPVERCIILREWEQPFP